MNFYNSTKSDVQQSKEYLNSKLSHARNEINKSDTHICTKWCYCLRNSIQYQQARECNGNFNTSNMVQQPKQPGKDTGVTMTSTILGL
jgi:hypothetical protein